MATTTNYAFNKPTVGGNEDTWGTLLNSNWDSVDAALKVVDDKAAFLDGVTATAAEINKIDGFTGTVADLNYAKDLRATGVTATEFDYLDGVTSAIQTQINAKAALSSPSFTGTPTAPTAASGTNTTQIATTAFVQQKAASLGLVGVGQTWQNMIASRSTGGVSYQNTTGKPITVAISVDAASGNTFQVSTNGSTWVTVFSIGSLSGDSNSLSVVVPDDHYYRYVGTPDNLLSWAELR